METVSVRGRPRLLLGVGRSEMTDPEKSEGEKFQEKKESLKWR